MVYPPGTNGIPDNRAEIEHLDNEIPNRKAGNIWLCCHRCNRMKSAQKLMDWLDTDYCKKIGTWENRTGKIIDKNSVAFIIKEYRKDYKRGGI